MLHCNLPQRPAQVPQLKNPATQLWLQLWPSATHNQSRDKDGKKQLTKMGMTYRTRVAKAACEHAHFLSRAHRPDRILSATNCILPRRGRSRSFSRTDALQWTRTMDSEELDRIWASDRRPELATAVKEPRKPETCLTLQFCDHPKNHLEGSRDPLKLSTGKLGDFLK